jgi:hypothetical protein
MDLNVDRLSENMIALAHNGIQNGDVMADPDVQVIIYSGTKSAAGITFQNDYVGIYRMRVITSDSNVKSVFFSMTG